MNDMPVDRLTILWEKYLADEMSQEERTEFIQLGAHPSCKQKLEELIGDVFESNRFSTATGVTGNKDLIFQEIMRKAESDQPAKKMLPRIQRIARWSWAAAILLFGVGAWFWFAHKEKRQPVVVTATPADISPGKDGAVLTLANGTQVLLDSVKDGIVALQGDAKAQVVNGSLVYESTGTNWVYNTVSTPRGRHFHVTLPDGSNVWLNSVSSVRYPTSFTGPKREVVITGEAYFEVAHNTQMPFIVNVNNKVSVEVRGTHFNINSYENETGIKTTLLEGSVKVEDHQSATGNGRSAVLKPGEQAIASVNSPFTIDHSPNLEQVMAWKNGVFNFEDLSLKDAMRQLERWYDIDVVYEGAVPGIYFTGKMSRDINLDGVLTLLRDANVHYRMEANRRLIVTQ